ncbi:M1 family metallopeptidase [Candidatus Nanosynbacter sp. TM7-053]|uniref:M1 family metallopeptidase n=1 Tax=Candidatus Nanosynbacter sp. TM7-053 TaxID=2902634 RepID=UPI001FB573DA|nr:M1 family metallopeptidase [Candidatus Nanosynbacter sp. TM7-053]MCJ1965950.1 M1 family metallopeptidase [Candidatus Nanosynbacter sp. TM7-053]
MTKVPRLLDTFTPNHYNLTLDLTRAEEKEFSGTVIISGDSTSESISLHSKGLIIQSATIDNQPADVSFGEFDELRLSQPNLENGNHTIHINFSGTITDAMHGLYPCYFTHDGVKKQLFATQFESHHAREVFPCVDEPAAKAEYDLTLVTRTGITVLGNMPVKFQKENGDSLTTTFEKTPRMSSYLLAFVIGELHKKSAHTKSGVEVNVWATPAQNENTLDFALDIATRSIDFYDEYFGVKYPLPKSDHVALPDFSSGAMENWGLITYRESCLLADPELTPESSRRFIATVIAHELSHQWFGNLVTMQWWNDLWLNESFANMMEYVAIDALQPNWHMWEDFATNEVTAALRRDSLDGVQSVQADVNHPDEISTLFDPAIVYAKGGRLLVMVRKLIGEEAFRAGLKSYFEKFAYKNTVGNDLWQELESASGQPIVNLMNTWISQPGLPVVSVSNSHDAATLSQERFFIGEHQLSDALWPIPLFANQPLDVKILDQKEVTVSIEKPLQLNCGLSAHFVAKYDESTREYLLKNITKLPTLDKICILQDATILARAGFENSASLLPLALSLKTETNEKVFGMAASALSELRKFVDDNDTARDSLKKISGEFARATFEELGWDEKAGESDDDRERRTTALGLMMYSEDKEVLNEAKTRFDNNKLEDLPTEIRALIISANVRHFETPEMIENLFATYKNTPSNDLQNDIAIGLTSTKNPETAEKILANIKDSNIIRPQDASRWFVYLIRTRESRQIAWNWLKENWAWVEGTFGEDKSYDDFIRYAATALLTPNELDDFRQFFEPMMDIPALARTIKLGITEISARVELIERDKADVLSALQTTL